jgi:hypothetical protein
MGTLLKWHADWINDGQHMMTARVEALNTLVGPSSRRLPALLTLPAAATAKLTTWWRGRQSSLMMSDEWLKDYRWSSRVDH